MERENGNNGMLGDPFVNVKVVVSSPQPNTTGQYMFNFTYMKNI